MKSPVSCKARAMAHCSKPDCVYVKATSRRKEYCKARVKKSRSSSKHKLTKKKKRVTVDAGSLDDVLTSAVSSKKELNLRARQLLKSLLENSIARLETSVWQRFRISKRMLFSKTYGLKTSESKESHTTKKLDFLAATILKIVGQSSKKIITAESILDVFKKDSMLNEFFTHQSLPGSR